MKTEFLISNFSLQDNGKLKARFDVTLASGLRINGMSLLESASGARWINFPARKLTAKETGKVTWAPHVEIKDRGRLNQFRDGVLAAIDALKP